MSSQLCQTANNKDRRDSKVDATSRSVFIIIVVFGLNVNPIVLGLRRLLTTVKYESDVKRIAEPDHDVSCEAASASEITTGCNRRKRNLNKTYEPAPHKSVFTKPLFYNASTAIWTCTQL